MQNPWSQVNGWINIDDINPIMRESRLTDSLGNITASNYVHLLGNNTLEESG